MSKGTDWRKLRLDGPTWDAYADACLILNGDTDRSKDMREHVLATIARAQGAQPLDGVATPPLECDHTRDEPEATK